jgi:hypothetical protein
VSRHGQQIASLINIDNLEQSPHDDMESLGYVLLYLLRGSLPWQEISANSDDRTNEERESLILEAKKRLLKNWGTLGDVPCELKKYFELLRQRNTPVDYACLRRLFGNLFRREGFEYDRVFDWIVLKFLSSQCDAKRHRE